MKKYLLILILIAIAACSSNESESKSENKDSNEVYTEAVEQPVILSYSYTKGQKFSYRLTTISETKQQIVADTTIATEMDQTVKYELGLTVDNVDSLGNTEISMVVNSVSLKSSMNGEVIEYDSKKSPEIGNDNSIIDYRVMLNKPFQIKINNTGEVTDVSNVSSIVNKFIDHQFQGQPLKPEQKKEVEERLKTGMIMPVAQQLFKVMPNKEVNKDSTWTRSYKSPFAVFEIDNNITFKVAGFNKDNNSVKIDMNLTSVSSGQTEATENGVNYKFQKPVINGKGTIDFDYENCLINKSETETNISISLSMEGKTSDNQTSIVTRKDSTKNINIVERI